MRLIRHSARLAIVKLPPRNAAPAWAEEGHFSSITRTTAELSIVCEDRLVPADVPSSGDWVWLEVEGPLPFSMVGVLADLTVPLAEAGVGVFTIATHNTDHLLIRSNQEQVAHDALTSAGHEVVAADPMPAQRPES